MSGKYLEVDLVEKAYLLYDTKRYEQAIETLLSLNATPSTKVQTQFWWIYAFSLINLEKSEEALSFILSKLEDHPYSPDLFFLLSRIYIEKNLPSEALKCILKAIEIRPEIDYYHSTASSIYLGFDEVAKAEYHISIAEGQNPENEQNIYMRSLISIHQNDHKRAQESINRGLSLFPKSTHFLVLFKHLKSNARPSISTLKELSLNALEENPFDESAKASLLFTLKYSNPFVRFFVSNGFNRYNIEWTPWRIIMCILFWKGTFIWGGFGLIYLLVTWAGTALFYTLVRKHYKYKYVLHTRGISMSNTFIIILGIAILGTVFLYHNNPSGEILFMAISGFLFILLTAISYFEIDTKSGKKMYSIFMIISIVLLSFCFANMILFGILSILLLLVYAFLFTLNIAFK